MVNPVRASGFQMSDVCFSEATSSFIPGSVRLGQKYNGPQCKMCVYLCGLIE